MKEFFLGIVFILIIYPVLEGCLSLFNQTMKWICTWIAVKTYKLEQQIEEDVPQSSFAIGFQVPNEETEEDKYDE